jgi:hypothetical protein
VDSDGVGGRVVDAEDLVDAVGRPPLALIYFLFQAPLTCGAEIRGGGHCRNNSHGILLGCHLRQHKWQRFRDVFVSRKWRDVFHDLTETPKDKLGTASALISVFSLFAGLPLWFLR